MHRDRQNVREHDQEAGNLYITHPLSGFSGTPSALRRPASSLGYLQSSPVRRPPSAVCRLASPFRPLVRRLASPIRRPSSQDCRLSSVVRRLSSPVCRPSSAVCRLAFAFTLVELMVVVAIISILLMLLIPNIRTMREKAWSANCQNNLRQYGIAMNQYMADHSGYFIYPGAGGRSAGGGYDDSNVGLKGRFDTRVAPSGGQAGSVAEYWYNMIPEYIPAEVTLQSLLDGNPSVRVCPVVMQQIRKDGNFFDPDLLSICKGLRDSTDWAGQSVVLADFEQLTSRSSQGGYDANNKLILDTGFTTYAINITQLYKNKKDIPANVIAFIDWNAREGWWATLSYTNWMYNGTDSKGVAVKQTDPPKRVDGAWWLSEVGFNHLQGKVYGANYVAMDGHVAWIGSNTISVTNFTTGL